MGLDPNQETTMNKSRCIKNIPEYSGHCDCPECKPNDHKEGVMPKLTEFDDHMRWLESVFIRARANSSGEKFDSIIETQERVIKILEEVTGGAVPDFDEIYKRQ